MKDREKLEAILKEVRHLKREAEIRQGGYLRAIESVLSPDPLEETTYNEMREKVEHCTRRSAEYAQRAEAFREVEVLLRDMGVGKEEE